MIQKKVCMLGATGVGKTSLVSRFVTSLFSDKYLTTIGVKVDKKTLVVDGTDVTLLLWDIYGQDEFQTVRTSYLKGASGYLLVADGTRQLTLETARELQKTAEGVIGAVPFILVLNKMDLADEWRVDDRALWRLAEDGWSIIRTSAKSGAGVDDAFLKLTQRMVAA
ncbi:MAG TPA: Rab family GTPase [Vicinamibacterales bacterium]|nr:Rab family GTPase [Vicinamibacterales bacterium]